MYIKHAFRGASSLGCGCVLAAVSMMCDCSFQNNVVYFWWKIITSICAYALPYQVWIKMVQAYIYFNVNWFWMHCREITPQLYRIEISYLNTDIAIHDIIRESIKLLLLRCHLLYVILHVCTLVWEIYHCYVCVQFFFFTMGVALSVCLYVPEHK